MPCSLPALIAAVAEPERVWPCRSTARLLLQAPLVPAYRVPVYGRRAQRYNRLADAVALLAERLHRLPTAYRHWQHFDPGAYFDLRPVQVLAMVRSECLGATLDVTVYADLLSPAFRLAEQFWAERFCPAYHAGHGQRDSAFAEHLTRQVLPAMERRLEQAREEIAAAGELLFERGDVPFLLAAAAPEERERQLPRLASDEEDLVRLFRRVPSLTLSRSFDLLDIASSLTTPSV